MTTVTTYPDILTRPFHFEQGKELYDPTDTIATSISIATQKADIIAQVNTSFNALVAAMPAQEAALEAQRTAILNQISTSFPTGTVSGTLNAQTVLDGIKQDAITIITTDTNPDQQRTYDCPECNATGIYANETGEIVESPLCDGYGLTLVQKELLAASRVFVDA